MGIFNFIKTAGDNLFGTAKRTKANEKIPPGGEKRDEIEVNKRIAEKLEQTIKDLKLEVDRLNISIENELAKVSGTAKDQTTREKVILVIGNVEGIAQVEDNMEVENREPEAIFHTVERGDTLGQIAKEYYGSAAEYNKIFEANQPMLKDPDSIYPGQVLRIPPMQEKEK
jgi:nucleoid-associated protein YgaU